MFVVNRDAHHSNYTCIANAVLRDTRLSLAARGFMAVVLSLPDDWEFSIGGMAKFCNKSRANVERFLAQLEQAGYLRREQPKDNIGRFVHTCYYFFEQPCLKNPCTDEPCTDEPRTDEPRTDEPRTDEPRTENCTQLNTNKQNTETKQSTDLTKPRGGAEEVERQIEADALRAEFGRECIDGAVRVISGALKAKQRTYSGVSVDNAELRRVFGAAGAEDVRAALRAIEGNNYSSFGGYFGAVLFRMVRDRLDCPRVRHEREFSASSIDVDEVMESILAKYRNVGS